MSVVALRHRLLLGADVGYGAGPDLELVIRTSPSHAGRPVWRQLSPLAWLHVPAAALAARGSDALVPAVLAAAVVAASVTVAERRGAGAVGARLTAAAILLVAAVVLVGLEFGWPGAGATSSSGAFGVLLAAVDAIVCVAIGRNVASRSALLAGVNAALEMRLARESSEIARLGAALHTTREKLAGSVAEHERAAAERAAAAAPNDDARPDAVTGLPNRELVLDRLRVAVAAAASARSHVLVLYLDLADLTAVNATTGYACGDEALRIIAARIRRCIRSGDTASRVGGDEFVIVCAAHNAAAESAAIAERLIAMVAEPIHTGASRMSLGSNIGISIAPVDGTDPSALIQLAGAAMYRAKELGINTFHRSTAGIAA